MSKIFTSQERESSGQQADMLTPAGLDFMTVSFQNDRLVVGGNVVQSSARPGRLNKLLIDASAGPVLIWFRQLEVPAEVNTAWDGKLSIKPTDGVTLLPLVTAAGVLDAMGFSCGLPVGPIVSTEAILGFITELKVENGALVGPSGQPVSRRICHGILSRLGVHTNERASISECLALCDEMGIQPQKENGLASALRDTFAGPAHRLYRCLTVMEERGYHVRLRGRITSVCRPVPAAQDPSNIAGQRLFCFGPRAQALATAA
jgi:hypothetical protein